MESFPSRSPNAKHEWDEGLAAKVPDLMPLVFSIVEISLIYPLVS
jgi:hypothetical protein